MSGSPGWVLVRLAFRQLLGGKRLWGAGLLAGLAPAVALGLQAFATPSAGEMLELHTSLLVPVILPLAALVFATGVFGAELEDGTITFILGKPVARWRITVARIAAASVLTGLLSAGSSAVTILVPAGGLDPHGLVWGFPVALALGGVVYSAIFVALSLVIRRALLAGLVYVILWEGMLSDLFLGTRALSVRQHTLAVADALVDAPPGTLEASLDVSTALTMAALLTAGASLVAVWRLSRFEIARAG